MQIRVSSIPTAILTDMVLPAVGGAVGAKVGVHIGGNIGRMFVPIAGYKIGRVIGAGIGGALGTGIFQTLEGKYLIKGKSDPDYKKIAATALVAGLSAASGEVLRASPFILESASWGWLTKVAQLIAGSDGSFLRLGFSNVAQGALYRGVAQGWDAILDPYAIAGDVLIGHAAFHGPRFLSKTVFKTPELANSAQLVPVCRDGVWSHVPKSEADAAELVRKMTIGRYGAEKIKIKIRTDVALSLADAQALGRQTSDFKGLNLSGVQLAKSFYLSNLDLTGANLTGAVFVTLEQGGRFNFSHTLLQGATICNGVGHRFTGADLRGARLDKVLHFEDPSYSAWEGTQLEEAHLVDVFWGQPITDIVKHDQKIASLFLGATLESTGRGIYCRDIIPPQKIDQGYIDAIQVSQAKALQKSKGSSLQPKISSVYPDRYTSPATWLEDFKKTLLRKKCGVFVGMLGAGKTTTLKQLANDLKVNVSGKAYIIDLLGQGTAIASATPNDQSNFFDQIAVDLYSKVFCGQPRGHKNIWQELDEALDGKFPIILAVDECSHPELAPQFARVLKGRRNIISILAIHPWEKSYDAYAEHFGENGVLEFHLPFKRVDADRWNGEVDYLTNAELSEMLQYFTAHLTERSLKLFQEGKYNESPFLQRVLGK